jgi:hypothetical protein
MGKNDTEGSSEDSSASFFLVFMDETKIIEVQITLPPKWKFVLMDVQMLPSPFVLSLLSKGCVDNSITCMLRCRCVVMHSREIESDLNISEFPKESNFDIFIIRFL